MSSRVATFDTVRRQSSGSSPTAQSRSRCESVSGSRRTSLPSRVQGSSVVVGATMAPFIPLFAQQPVLGCSPDHGQSVERSPIPPELYVTRAESVGPVGVDPGVRLALGVERQWRSRRRRLHLEVA